MAVESDELDGGVHAFHFRECDAEVCDGTLVAGSERQGVCKDGACFVRTLVPEQCDTVLPDYAE
jgi:hypothetical protein